MAKLVLLSEGYTGRMHELAADKTTVGRVEDNVFQVPDPSVSSHHCEVLRRGDEVIVKDLNSTNGTFIDGQQITGEHALKHGQILRLGQIQMRLETGVATTTPPPKPSEQTQTIIMEKRGGVSLNELEAGPRGAGFNTAGTAFSKKSNKSNLVFIIVAAVLGLIIIGGMIIALLSVNK